MRDILAQSVLWCWSKSGKLLTSVL
jgi:hypothetical protein